MTNTDTSPASVQLAIGQLARDRTRSTFKVVIVIGASNRHGKVRVCRWQHERERWSAPSPVATDMLERFANDVDLTTRRGLVIAAARRNVNMYNAGKVRWPLGGGFEEIAYVTEARL